MIAVNLIIIYRDANRTSDLVMSATCDSQTFELNNKIRQVELTVENLYEISERIRPDIEDLKTGNTANAFCEEFRQFAVTIAENTTGARAIYYRMNPEVTGSGTTGFFYVKSTRTNKFIRNAITDLYVYDPEDKEHVGWYYEPVNAGKPVWMEPYFNANIGVYMISYVMPMYENGELIGVVGIDVDFNEILRTASDVDMYPNDGAVLYSEKSGTIYYNHTSLLGDSLPAEVKEVLHDKRESHTIEVYEINNDKFALFFKELSNDMKYVLYAKNSDRYLQGKSSVITSLIIFSIVFVITLIVSIIMGRRIVRPIVDITEATKKYAEGEWDVKVKCNTHDELQLLAENVSLMADKTKEYIDYIQNMAKKDALTGLRNKTDYLLYVDKINNEYIPEKKNFAIVVFDVNNLKKVNDNYGHEKGDELIVSASRAICSSFSHSPVFRVGGDEFVAIIDGADYEDIETIVEDFHNSMMANKDSEDIMTVCIASGYSVFGKDGETYDEIFEAADQKMYDNKVMLKNGVAPR